MSRPLVTIVTPSFNQAEFIATTIESVLAQDYPRIEYIVMDGGSTDGTAEVAGRYRGRLVWVSEPDRGQSHAINKGFRRARGEIVAWLNSDDVLLPGAVSAAVAALEACPGAGAVYGEGLLIDREGRSTGRFPATTPFNLWLLTFLSDSILQQSSFFRRSAVEAAGWLREDLHWAMDWDLFVRLGTRHGLCYLPVELGCLREYGETKTAAGGLRRFRELRRLLRRQTGLAWAPGCWTYGLDTIDRVSAPWLSAHLPARTARFFQKLCRWQIDRVHLHSQGYYPGAWAGPRLLWLFPAPVRRFTVHGEVPAWPGAPPSQRLRILQDGRLLAEARFPAGLFEWILEAAPPPAACPVSLRIESEWSARPPEGPALRRDLRLSWRLHCFETPGVAGGHNSVCGPSGSALQPLDR
jgi:hypothetical protein